MAAAFIGPGTVTTCSLAGAQFGPFLLWVLGLAVLSAVVLQEMAARLGVVGRLGLGEALRRRFARPPWRQVVQALVLSAITLGCAAYETGNLLGAALGGEVLLGVPARVLGPACGLLLVPLIALGGYRLLERLLLGAVLVMSGAFLTTALLLRPSPLALLAGLRPSVPEGGLYLALALLGTTIVPYNLFLHASAARERWSGPAGLGEARWDAAFSIALGGVISAAVLVTAWSAFYGRGMVIEGVPQMAEQLAPVLGGWAPGVFGVGLLAAGLTSGLTAPLAAGYATTGGLGWEGKTGEDRRKWVGLAVVAVGVVFSALALRPVPAIVFAQVVNGLFLPLVAGFLLIVANDRAIMRGRVNSPLRNGIAGLVVVIMVLLGVNSVIRLL